MDMRRDLSDVSFLIVEDNVHMRSILRSILGGFGARYVCEASDGADGLEAVLDRRPDFILCDWVMKPVNGADFIRTLRSDSDPILNTIPVVIVSAHCHRSTIVEAVNVGIHGFIAKPVSPAILYGHIVTVMEKQKLHGRSRGLLFGPAAERRNVQYSRNAPKRTDVGKPADNWPEPDAMTDLALL
jgi:two-component system chemotaxis response regulator CheY